MRRTLPLLVVAGLLASGCASPDFRTLAMNAPALLKADASPTGTLQRETGTSAVDMTMAMEGHNMTMHMAMDVDKEHFQGGAYLTTMTMKDLQMDGKGSGLSMTFKMFCSPAHLILIGMPGAEAKRVIDNPIHECPSDDATQMTKETRAKLDAQTQALVGQVLNQSAVPKLDFVTVTKEQGKDLAVYETTVDMDMSGMTMHFTVESRATLQGARIAHMDTTGQGDMTMPDGSGMTSHMTMSGGTTYTYGTRAPIPAEYL